MINVKVLRKSNAPDFEAKMDIWINSGWSLMAFDTSGNKLTALLAKERDDSKYQKLEADTGESESEAKAADTGAG